MRSFVFLLALVLTGLVYAETERFSAGHQQLVTAARAALAEEAYIRADLVTCSEEQLKDGRIVTTLHAPYSCWRNLAAKAEAKVTSGGKKACPEVSVKITTGNLVWSRHKEFEERVLKVIGVRVGPHKLNNTSPTAEPAKPIPEPKALEGRR